MAETDPKRTLAVTWTFLGGCEGALPLPTPSRQAQLSGIMGSGGSKEIHVDPSEVKNEKNGERLYVYREQKVEPLGGYLELPKATLGTGRPPGSRRPRLLV
uniref:Uncharacterized protein n=1 Tax=Lygus hesperus TaxID=30085 RepID=A0A0K8T616_LYGHE